jgi:hypothetical protein
MCIKRIIVYLLIPFLSLLMSACGGGGGGDTAAAVTPTNTDCVLSTSKIGDCKI